MKVAEVRASIRKPASTWGRSTAPTERPEIVIWLVLPSGDSIPVTMSRRDLQDRLRGMPGEDETGLAERGDGDLVAVARVLTMTPERALGVVGCCRCDDCKDCRRVGCVCDLRGRRAIAPLRRKLADEIARLEATEAELLPLPVEDAWAEERAEWSRRDVRRGRSRG